MVELAKRALAGFVYVATAQLVGAGVGLGSVV